MISTKKITPIVGYYLAEHEAIPAPILPDMGELTYNEGLALNAQLFLGIGEYADNEKPMYQMTTKEGSETSSQWQVAEAHNFILKMLQDAEKTNQDFLSLPPVKSYSDNVEDYTNLVNKNLQIMLGVLTPLWLSIHGFDLRTKIYSTVLRKNHDYGNSFDKVVDQYGLAGAMIRITDKVNRLSTLTTTTSTVDDESTVDTLLDIVGYMLLILNYYTVLSED